MTLFDLSGKVAIITGSSRGIGRAIGERMAEHGARVVISSRKVDACNEVAASINTRYGDERAISIPANVQFKEDLQKLVDTTLSKWGKIDALVCNAATNPYYGPSAGITDEQFRRTLEVNVIAQHWLIHMVAPQMRARKDGTIIIMSSIGGLKGSPIIGAYHISKAADFALARNLACEFGLDNVRVNCVAPGLIKTDFSKALWSNPEVSEQVNGNSMLRRIGEPDEVAGAAVFLSSAAGKFITGQTIVIDGGVMAA